MKRKLVLKTENLRVLTTKRLDTVVGGAQYAGTSAPSEIFTQCSCPNSQASICDIWGGKG